MSSSAGQSRKTICYYYDGKSIVSVIFRFLFYLVSIFWYLSKFVLLFLLGDIGNYYYGQGHPMKPHRMRMAHNLILNYGLYRKMEIYVRFIWFFIY